MPPSKKPIPPVLIVMHSLIAMVTVIILYFVVTTIF